MAKMFDPHWNKGDKRVSQFFEKQASKEQDAPPAAPKAASESLLLTHVCDRESTGYKVKTADGLRRNEKTTFSPTLGMGHPPPRPPSAERTEQKGGYTTGSRANAADGN
jgi:hypothetical protein